MDFSRKFLFFLKNPLPYYTWLIATDTLFIYKKKNKT